MNTWNRAEWGWHSSWDEAFVPYEQEGYIAGRVILEHKHMYRLVTEHGELLGELTGRMRHLAEGRADYPAVGDWVAVRPRLEDGRAAIHGILPRFSKFSRRAAGSTVEEQIVAANVDTVFLVHALNQDFNLRRLERYLTLAYESGAMPVVLLSKADLCSDIAARISEVEGIAPGTEVHVVSTLREEGLDLLTPYLVPGRTVALLGSSGAGKSTLVNRLYGEEILATGGIREGDDHGRHTTTHRELVRLPSGGLLIDTPGMRELQLWDADEGLGTAFRDIEALAADCRFGDCGHRGEPGCAIQAALAGGSLDEARYRSYLKLQKELAYEARKEDPALQRQEKDKWKKIHQTMRKNPKQP